MAKVPKPRKKSTKNGYEFPETLKKGTILTDLSKKRWAIEKSIGKGGFGEIYAARDDGMNKSEVVIKIEPHVNGPLFVEMHFYMKNCKSNQLETYQKNLNLKHLGIPTYLGTGSLDFNEKKYRFLIIPKFQSDLNLFISSNHGKLSEPIACEIAKQMIDALSYIHGCGYAHLDIKSSNILLNDKNQAYLADFGLVARLSTTNQRNPKKAHDGTPEYVSRDGHRGVASRRGDLEILAYNLIEWLGGRLPWLNSKKNLNQLEQMKQSIYENLDDFLKKSFNSNDYPKFLWNFIELYENLEFNTIPDYEKIKQIFMNESEKKRKSPKLNGTNKKRITKKSKLDSTPIDGAMTPAMQEVLKKKMATSSTTETNRKSEKNKMAESTTNRNRRNLPIIDYKEN